MRGRIGGMSLLRKQLGHILHHAAIKLANYGRSNPGALFGIYMLPASIGLMIAKTRLFGISDDLAASLAVASLLYMSIPALWLLMLNLATGGARFRLQVLLIVLAIIVISVGLAYWLAGFVSLKN